LSQFHTWRPICSERDAENEKSRVIVWIPHDKGKVLLRRENLILLTKSPSIAKDEEWTPISEANSPNFTENDPKWGRSNFIDELWISVVEIALRSRPEQGKGWWSRSLKQIIQIWAESASLLFHISVERVFDTTHETARKML
jgi:hypothetical protein